MFGKEELLGLNGPKNGLALYLWRFHNAVSARVAAEQGCEGDRRWPSKDMCPQCWNQTQDSGQMWDVLDEAHTTLKATGVDPSLVTGFLPDESKVVNILAAKFWKDY